MRWAVAGLLDGRDVSPLEPFAIEVEVDTDDAVVVAAVELAARERGLQLVRLEP